MWKNKGDRKGIKDLYVVFRVRGVNLDRFINTLKKRKIALYDLKKDSLKQLNVTVSHKDSQNFFAIAKDLCYNVKKVRFKGKGYPLFMMLKALPSVIGVALFTLCVCFANDLVLSISFSGNASAYQRQVQDYLAGNGIKPFVRYSSLDISRLEDQVLSDNPHLSFVSITKHGTRLNFNLVTAKDAEKKISGDVYELFAPCDGVIEQIKVYRGTAEVKEGDVVKEGQLLVGGYALVKEQKVSINLLALISMRVSEVYEYYSPKDNDEESAKLFALGESGERQILYTRVQKQKDKNGYIYRVTAYYRQVIYAG